MFLTVRRVSVIYGKVYLSRERGERRNLLFIILLEVNGGILCMTPAGTEVVSHLCSSLQEGRANQTTYVGLFLYTKVVVPP